MSTLGVGYIRVSKERDEMISPDTQRGYIEAFAAREGIEIVEWLQDLDRSGRDFTKRQVEHMVDGVREGSWQTVVLWKWSRWGRNLQESTLFMAQIEQAGGAVRAATEDFDRATMMGKFNSDLQLLLAELESNKISESWMDAQSRRRSLGLPHSGQKRIGYTYDRENGYQVDPDMAPLVREAYERYVKGASLRGMAMEWNRLGITTTKGNAWTATSFGRMLDTGFAAGLIRERSAPPKRPGGVKLNDFDTWREGAHEAIIDQDTWTQYYATRVGKLGTNAKSKAPSHDYTGILRCYECDATLAPIKSSSWYGWRCWRAVSNRAHVAVTVANRTVENAVRDWLATHAERDETVAERAFREREARRVKTDAQSLEKAIQRLERQRERAADAYMAGAFDVEELKTRQTAIDAELSELRAGLLETQKSHENITSIPSKQDFSDALVAWSAMDHVHRNEFLCSLVDCIVVRPGKVAVTRNKVTIVPVWEKVRSIGKEA